MTSPINLGVRHVLVIYPLVAIAAAFGVVRLADRAARYGLVLAAATTVSRASGGAAVIRSSNQITYFNAFAGSDRAYIFSDSDFDWDNMPSRWNGISLSIRCQIFKCS